MAEALGFRREKGLAEEHAEPSLAPLQVLLLTNMYPTEATPTAGTFVATQVESIRAAGVDVEVLHVPRRVGGRRVYRRLGERIRQAVTASDPDVVHVAYGGVMAAVATRAVRDRPVVVTFHGTDVLGGTDDGRLATLTARVGVIASRRAAGRAAGVIVVSRNVSEALPHRIDRSRVWLVPNGIDLGRFRPLPKSECRELLGWDPGRKHVLFPSSRSRGVKRFELARQAMEQLGRDVPGAELHVLEGVPPDAVPTWMNASDAVLLTSEHEGSPVVVKEALACNVPVVSVEVGDVPERLEGVDGCFVVASTPDVLADALGRVLARDAPIAGRERVADLALERVARRVTAVYTAVLTGETADG